MLRPPHAFAPVRPHAGQLSPPPRAPPKTAVSAETRRDVKNHAYRVCAESPCKRDAMRKHVGPRVWEPRQALILPFTKETLRGLLANNDLGSYDPAKEAFKAYDPNGTGYVDTDTLRGAPRASIQM